jgi:hypothetical protein
MPQLTFGPMIPAFECTKTVHALDRAVNVIGSSVAIAPGILNLGTRQRSGVNFTLRPLYPQEKCFGYQLDTRLRGSKCQCGHCDENKNIFLLLAVKLRHLCR